MSAFVPTPGLSLKVQTPFTGTAVSSIRDETPQKAAAVTMAADGDSEKKGLPFKLPNLPTLPKLPKLPNLPNLPNLPGKNIAAKASAAAATAVAPKPAKIARPVTLKVGESKVTQTGSKDQAVMAKRKSIARSTKLGLASGTIPKFYNPTSARYEFRANAMEQNITIYDVRYSNNPIVGAVPTAKRENPNDTFRNMDPYTDDPVWARSGWSSDEARVAAGVAMRNVLGNANLFESEVAELDYSISCLYKTADMKEFIRAVGLSNAYRKRYFEKCSNVRFVELNFKHFLGRAPRSQAEMSEHIQRVTTEGYNAEINSFIDSDEYAELWGNSRIPQVNFRGGHPYNIDMNKLALLNGSYSTPDTTTKSPLFPSADASKVRFSSFSILKGLPEAWRGENRARSDAGLASSFPESFWNPLPQQVALDELDWKMRFGSNSTYWYKESSIYKNMMKPILSHPEEEKIEAEAILKYGSLMAKNYV